MQRVLISIKPSFVDKIFSNDKTVELRKRIPRLSAGDELLVYASAPVMAIVGAVEVVDVVQNAPDDLWKLVKAYAAVEHEFYEAYYRDHSTAYGIFLGRTKLYRRPCSLDKLRSAWPGFAPPQNYRFVQLWNPLQHTLTEADRLLPTVRAGAFGVHAKR